MTRPTNRARHLLYLGTVLLLLGAPIAVVAQESPTESATQKAFADAEELYQKGEWGAALAAFQLFEWSHRYSTAVPQAIYYQGWCWFNMKKYADAINVFERLIKSYPDSAVSPQATLKLAENYREMNNLPKAIELYRQFQSHYPKNEFLPQAMLGEAWMLFKQNDLAGAKRVLENVRSQFADDPVVGLDALFLLGQILTGEKNFAAASAVYRQIAVQRKNPRATEGLFLAGEAMYEAKRYADAINYFKRVQSRAELLANIEAEISNLDSQRVQFLQRGALATYQERREALRQLYEKFKQGPELRSSALFRIANSYQALGQPEEASVVYRQFLNLFPKDKLAEQAHFGFIQTLTERKLLKIAEEEVAKFKTAYPASKLLDAASFVQAETLFGTGQHQKAMDLYRDFLSTAKEPELIETARFRVASCLFGLEQFENARIAFSEFINTHRNSTLIPEAFFRIGRSHFEISQRAADPQIAQANLSKAAEAYEQIRAQHPASDLLPEVTFQLGYLYGYLGAYDQTNFEKSVSAFRDFASRWPNHRLVPEAIYQAGKNQLALGQFENAVASYKELVERHSDNELAPFAAFEIANAYASAKRPDAMIGALREYVKRHPDHSRAGDALFAIANELENQKKYDEAIADYRNLIARAVAAANPPEELRNAAIAAQIRVAAVLEQRGSVAEAVKDCEGFLAKFSNEPVAARAIVAQIASLYRKARQLTEAYAKLDQLAAQYQQNPTIRVAVATSAVELALGENDLQRAQAAALRLLADPEKDRLPAGSYLAIGNTLLKLDQFAQARDVFQKCLASHAGEARSTPIASLGLGQAYLGLGQYEQAEAAFNEMLAADPQNAARPEAELGLARVYEARNQTKQAVDLYNKVMGSARGETAAEASFRLAQLAYAQKDYKLAIAYYLRVSLMAGGEMGEEAAFRAAQCHEGLGNIEAARNAYQAYLRRFASGKFAEEARAKLASLPAPKPQT